jgi:nucleotide-binding universal stress UspA family protein
MTIYSPELAPELPPEHSLPANTYTDTVVVGVDGSPASQQALRWARFLSEATKSPLAAVSVWDQASVYGWAAGSWSAMPANWDPSLEARRGLTATLDAVFDAQRPTGLRTAVVEGNVARTLLEVSRGARMLVVGSRGHGGFAGLLLGSVSSACAEHATCPVLIVHGHTPPPPG